MSLSVSVVVFATGDTNGECTTMAGLRRLDWSELEVVVVHDDQSLGPVGADTVKWVRCPETRLAAICNAGLAAAAGDLVVFIVGGWYPGPTWLSRLTSAFTDSEVAATGGSLFSPDGVTVDEACWAASSFGALTTASSIPSQDYWSSPFSDCFMCPIPGNTMFRREPLLDLGGYDQRYTSVHAHLDVCRRLLDRGWVVRPLPDAPVFTSRGMSASANADAAEFEDEVLFALRHGLSRHSFAAVTSSLATRAANSTSSDVAEASDRGFEKWRRVVIDSRPRPHRSPPAFQQFEPLAPMRRRLHICYVSQEWLPAHNGVARLVHARASGLAARGHLVRVLTLTEGTLSVALEDGIWVHRVPSTDHPFPPGVIMPPRLWNRSASVLDELGRIGQDGPIDIVDVPNWDVEGYATIVDGRFRTVLGLHSGVAAYVATDPRFSSDDPILREVLSAELTCYRHADAFLSASEAIVDEIEEGFDVTFPRDRLGLVPHGLPDEAGTGGDIHEIDDDDLNVLFVGRLEPRKGIDTLLEAVPAVVAAVPRVRFTIVGDDTIRSPGGSTFRREFEESPAGQQLADRVSFTGVVDDVELARRYGACDVFVAPSRFESFGLILLEAMRAGKAVIAGDAGGMSEVIGGDGAGLLVPPGDANALARAVVSLLSDPELRRSVGAIGRRRFEERFTRERMIDGIEDFFVRLVELETPGRHTKAAARSMMA